MALNRIPTDMIEDRASGQKLSEQLAQKANQTDVRLKEIKLEQTDLSATLLQQMAGTTPINAIPADGTITPAKTSFFKLGKNLYDKSKRQDGYRINSSGLVTQEGLAASYSTSGDIFVEGGKTLYISDNGVAWDFNRLVSYDASGNIVGFTTAAVTTYTVPANVVKIKFSGSITRMNGTVQVEYAQITPYETYGETINKQFIRELNDTFYVSPSGNDSNTGLSESQPFLTINKAILSGGKTIYVKRGVYTGVKIEASNIPELNIIPYGDGDFITLRVDAGQTFASPINLNYIPKIKLVGIKVENAGIKAFKIWGCNGELIKCESYASTSDGFSLDGSNLTVRKCKSINSVRDGFNAHALTTTTGSIIGHVDYYGCEATGSGDDGLSHHETCTANVFGGIFKNNVSGGITPYGQCVINVQNAVIEGNGMGLYGFQSGTILDNPTIYSNNNLIKSNGTGIIAQYYNIISIGDKLVGNTTNINQISGTVITY